MQTASKELARLAAEPQEVVGQFKCEGSGASESHITAKLARDSQLASLTVMPSATARFQ